MELTPVLKDQIDSRSYESLLQEWRYAPVGTPIFQGESGEYYSKRMAELRNSDPQGAVRASKNIGWQ